jgi:hypothetical protein
MLTAWASAPAARGSTPGLPPAPPTDARPAGTSIATCAHAPDTHSGCVVHPSPRCFVPPLPRSHLWLRGCSPGRCQRTTMPTMHARDMRFAQSLSKHWGALAPVRCRSYATPPTPPSSNPGTSVTPALPTFTASCLWCRVATCPVCLTLLQCSTLPARAPAGTAVHSRPLQKFRTEGFRFVLHVAGP